MNLNLTKEEVLELEALSLDLYKIKHKHIYLLKSGDLVQSANSTYKRQVRGHKKVFQMPFKEKLYFKDIQEVKAYMIKKLEVRNEQAAKHKATSGKPKDSI